jgi:hypothetical protein
MTPYQDPPLPGEPSPNDLTPDDLAAFEIPGDGMVSMPPVQQKAPSGVGFDWGVLNVQTQEEYDAKPPEIQHLIHEIKELGVLPSQEWAANRLIQIQKEISARSNPQAQATLAKAEAELLAKQNELQQKEVENQVALTRASNEFKRMNDLLDKLRDHPGRQWATGKSSIMPKVMGTDAYDFQVLLDQVRGKQFLAAFQSLKGGGPITDLEGSKAEAALARTNPGQSEEQFLAGLKDFKNFLAEEYNTTVSKFAPAPQATPQGMAQPAAQPTQPDSLPQIRPFPGGQRLILNPDGRTYTLSQ